MIYIGNFRNLEDILYTVVFNTGVESDSNTLSPSPIKVGNKYTIKLYHIGFLKPVKVTLR